MNQHRQNLLKITMLGSMPPLSGLSSYCFELSRAVSDFCDIEFLSFKSLYPSIMYPGGRLKDDNTFPEVIHKNLDVKRYLTWYNPFTWLFAGLFTKSNLLHAQWWSLPLFPIYMVICICFKIRNIPVIFTVHNILSHERSRLYFALSRFLFKFGDHFIVHTNTGLEQMVMYYRISKEKLSLIPHGTLDFHVKENIQQKSIRKEMGFHPENKVILFFGAIRPYKGLETLLESFKKVLNEISESRLLIAGKLWKKWKPYADIIKSLGISNCLTAVLDYIPSGEVYKYFVSSDLVVLPYHRFDSQSGVGTTAISFRKPLIVTNVGGLPDLVTDSRFVVPADDSEALASAILSCLNNPDRLKAMSQSSNAIAEKLFWPTIAKKTLQVYHNVLKH